MERLIIKEMESLHTKKMIKNGKNEYLLNGVCLLEYKGMFYCYKYVFKVKNYEFECEQTYFEDMKGNEIEDVELRYQLAKGTNKQLFPLVKETFSKEVDKIKNQDQKKTMPKVVIEKVQMYREEYEEHFVIYFHFEGEKAGEERRFIIIKKERPLDSYILDEQFNVAHLTTRNDWEKQVFQQMIVHPKIRLKLL
jgi:hypothetical protein